LSWVLGLDQLLHLEAPFAQELDRVIWLLVEHYFDHLCDEFPEVIVCE
jgi:hypothetical protein